MSTNEPCLLQLLQITDSSFPVGGFAYSHGLEWLARQQPLDEPGLREILAAYVDQVAFGQWLPAALFARRATTLCAILHCDERLDASIAAESERNAGRAMGERLLSGASETFGGERTREMLEAVTSGTTPGQYAVAFGVVASDASADERTLVSFLGFSMVSSVAQAAVRLGLIGQAASARLVAGASARIEEGSAALLESRRGSRFGAFTPALDVACLLHPTLPFRMFAS